MSAICAAVFTGTLMYRYSLYKIALGPEEERDEALGALPLPDGMAGVSGSIAGRVCFCILCGAGWLGMAAVYGLGWEYLLYGMAVSLLCSLAYVDLRIYELPPELNLVIAILAFIHLFLDLSHWYVYAIGAVCVSGLFLLMALLSRGKAMGGGDIKLMAALGLLLGWQKILLVLFLGAALGSLVHGLRILISKRSHLLAFGPYLAAAAVLAMLWGDAFVDWYRAMFLAF